MRKIDACRWWRDGNFDCRCGMLKPELIIFTKDADNDSSDDSDATIDFNQMAGNTASHENDMAIAGTTGPFKLEDDMETVWGSDLAGNDDGVQCDSSNEFETEGESSGGGDVNNETLGQTTDGSDGNNCNKQESQIPLLTKGTLKPLEQRGEQQKQQQQQQEDDLGADCQSPLPLAKEKQSESTKKGNQKTNEQEVFDEPHARGRSSLQHDHFVDRKPSSPDKECSDRQRTTFPSGHKLHDSDRDSSDDWMKSPLLSKKGLKRHCTRYQSRQKLYADDWMKSPLPNKKCLKRHRTDWMKLSLPNKKRLKRHRTTFQSKQKLYDSDQDSLDDWMKSRLPNKKRLKRQRTTFKSKRKCCLKRQRTAFQSRRKLRLKQQRTTFQSNEKLHDSDHDSSDNSMKSPSPNKKCSRRQYTTSLSRRKLYGSDHDFSDNQIRNCKSPEKRKTPSSRSIVPLCAITGSSDSNDDEVLESQMATGEGSKESVPPPLMPEMAKRQSKKNPGSGRKKKSATAKRCNGKGHGEHSGYEIGDAQLRSEGTHSNDGVAPADEPNDNSPGGGDLQCHHVRFAIEASNDDILDQSCDTLGEVSSKAAAESGTSQPVFAAAQRRDNSDTEADGLRHSQNDQEEEEDDIGRRSGNGVRRRNRKEKAGEEPEIIDLTRIFKRAERLYSGV